MDTSSFVAQIATPGATNVPVIPNPIVINEVDADTDGSDILEFVELYGDPNATLDGHVLVFYNGSSDTSYLAIDLDGQTLDANGFFVAGNTAVTNVDVVFADNGLQNGADAVALYEGDDTDFPNGTAVTDTNLLDALVYDTNDGDDSGLIDVLTPGQAQINEDGMGDKDFQSNSRVPDGGTPRETSTYTQVTPTPGESNGAGPVPDVVINEVDADTDGTDMLEFVELFGTPNGALDGLSVILFNGSDDASYAAFDLDGFSLDANGFFVLGNAAVANVDLVFPDNTLQNGADAVAILMDDAANFPEDTPVTNTNLIDAVVYDTADDDDSGLLDVLTPGQVQVNEDENGNRSSESIARLPDGGMPFQSGNYVAQAPTPGESNVPPLEIVINEVDADTAGSDDMEFVELFGTPNGLLDGLVLVLYNGNGDISYGAFDLDGFSLNAGGFFVLGNTLVPNVDLVLADNTLQNGADAVALYEGDATDFPNGTAVTATNLIDAIVYDTADADDSGLIDVLTPGQPQIDEDGAGDKDGHSNSRVPDGGMALNTSTYVQQAPTPGLSNVPTPVLPISMIQGNGFDSPVVGTVVRTEGAIVTATATDGFFIQTPDANVDMDTDTSEGIFVFINDPVAVGDEVNVEGLIEEFFGLTRFADSSTVDIVTNGNPVPAAINLDATIPNPDPNDALSLERFEGMLVSLAAGLAAGPTDQFGTTLLVANGTLPFREPGIEFPGMMGLPVWDGNREIFEIDAADGSDILARRGAAITGTGGLTFTFGDYQLRATTFTVDNDAAGGLSPRPVRPRNAGEITIGSLNLLRLFSTNGNYQTQLSKLSRYIRNVLESPDVLAVQECGSITELTDLANRINTDEPSVTYTPFLIEGNDPGSIDVGYLVRNSVSVNSVTQIQPNEDFMFDGNTFTLHDRPPLVLEGTYMPPMPPDARRGNVGTGTPITIINVHNRSLSGIDEGNGPFVRAKRDLQARRIADEIQALQTNNPSINLMVLGDFNGFQFTDGYVDVLGQISGNLDPLGALVARCGYGEPGPHQLGARPTGRAALLLHQQRQCSGAGSRARILFVPMCGQRHGVWPR